MQELGLQGSGQYYTLFKCFSGQISYDTTVCVDKQLYKNPFDFECPAGQYLDSFDSASSTAQSSPYEGDVHLNADNTLVAEVVAGSSVRISVAASSFTPLIRASAVLELARELNASDSYSLKYAARIFYAAQGASPRIMQFVHPVSNDPRFLNYMRDTSQTFSTTVPVIASAAWSFDGRSFFVTWMDGTISKAIITPEVGSCVFIQNHLCQK
jgi:hypothetical protein